MLKTTNLIGFGGGVTATGPQTIAPSSNDWDYTFNTSSDWRVAGNSLGDHTDGGYFEATNSSTSGLSSLITLDGDFIIEWTMTDPNNAAFGVHAIDEDDSRSGSGVDACNMGAMTNSFYYRDETTDFYIGSSAQSDTMTFGDGSVIKIERLSGTIKVYDDGSEVHSFSTTYSGTMRFAVGTPGSPIEADFANLKITDYSKIQRDGFLNEAHSDQSGFGNNQSNADRQGTEFIATRSGSCETLTFNLRTVTTYFNSKCQIWSSDGTSPASQVGGDSDTIALDSTGEKTYTWATNKPTLEKGKKYWWVTIDVSGGSGWVNPQFITGIHWSNTKGTGRHDTTTSITESDAHSRAFELKVDTSAGEPTPDHDTLFLIHSDTSDGSTTLTDSSQFGRTATVAGDLQHDTAQTLGFGSSSILFDGTGDYLTFPDSPDWKYIDFNAGFTFDTRIRFANVTTNMAIVSHTTSHATSGINFLFGIKTNAYLEIFISNAGSGLVFLGSSSGLSANTDYHLAIVTSQGKLYLFINGALDGTATGTMAPNPISAVLRLGTTSAAWGPLNGWMKEPRLSRCARWDAAFTPPTSVYP